MSSTLQRQAVFTRVRLYRQEGHACRIVTWGAFFTFFNTQVSGRIEIVFCRRRFARLGALLLFRSPKVRPSTHARKFDVPVCSLSVRSFFFSRHGPVFAFNASCRCSPCSCTPCVMCAGALSGITAGRKLIKKPFLKISPNKVSYSLGCAPYGLCAVFDSPRNQRENSDRRTGSGFLFGPRQRWCWSSEALRYSHQSVSLCLQS